MHTETLSIGSELLAGDCADTNVAWLGRELARLGLSLRRHTILPDRLDLVVSRLRDVRDRAERPALVILTGGLGPTVDDITRDAIAAAMDAPLVENAECRRAIEEMFRRRGLPVAPSNLRQALIPSGATPLPNPHGTAPGFHIARDRVHVFAMPGVPSEMMAMFADQVAPILRTLVASPTVILERTLHTFGAGESAVGEKIADHMARGRNPEVGTTVADGLVSVRLRATAPSPEEARSMLDREEAAIRNRLGDVCVGRDDDRLPHAVARLLSDKKATLAVAESCTGGLISTLLTDVPGASRFFIEAVVTYADDSKKRRLGVPAELLHEHGAVSDPVARAMAEGIRASADTTYGLAVTGIAGPTGATADKPVGLVFIALAGPEGTAAVRSILPGDRRRIRHRAALTALNLLRLRLLGR